MHYDYIGLSKVSERIYLGAAKEAIQESLLQEHGVTAVANLTAEYFGCDMDKFKYLQLDQDDTVEIPFEKIAKFLAWMDEREAAQDTVLIHCHMGISRTPAFLIAWWMHRSGATSNSDLRALWSEHEDIIGGIRPIIQPHNALKRSILAFFGYTYEWPVEKKAIFW
jgi:protein-tyrosine phosphatase